MSRSLAETRLFACSCRRTNCSASTNSGPFVEDESIETWLGPGAHILHAPICAGKVFNFSVCFRSDAVGGETWFTPGNKDELLAEIGRLVSADTPHHQERRSRRSLGSLRPRTVAQLVARPPRVSSADAAHAMLPYLGQGAAQTLETHSRWSMPSRAYRPGTFRQR